MNESITLRLGGQTNLSEALRVIIKRTAASNGGLVAFMKTLGFPYRRAYEQLNRNQGVLVDILPALTEAGIDEPLRRVADACGYDVMPKLKFLRTSHPPKPVRSYGLDMHHATATITRVLEEALADQRIDDKELEKLKARLHDARKTLAAFEAKITGLIA